MDHAKDSQGGFRLATFMSLHRDEECSRDGEALDIEETCREQ
jgi:hypothetical protein